MSFAREASELEFSSVDRFFNVSADIEPKSAIDCGGRRLSAFFDGENTAGEPGLRERSDQGRNTDDGEHALEVIGKR